MSFYYFQFDYRAKNKACHPAPFIPKGTPARGEISPLGASREREQFGLSKVLSGT